jgi:hypothetical protein
MGSYDKKIGGGGGGSGGTFLKLFKAQRSFSKKNKFSKRKLAILGEN